MVNLISGWVSGGKGAHMSEHWSRHIRVCHLLQSHFYRQVLSIFLLVQGDWQAERGK